jgi:hypothetical protein
MSVELGRVFFGAFFVWSILVARKAASALWGNKPYTFSRWDGGMLREGVTLSKLGAELKLVAAIVMAMSCGLGAIEPALARQLAYVAIPVSVVTVVLDFVLTAD